MGASDKNERARSMRQHGETDSATKFRWMLNPEFQATVPISHFSHGETGNKEMATELNRHVEAARIGDLGRP